MQTLSVTVTGTTATPSFSSSRTAVARVSNDGVVTAVSPGDATITVSAGGASAQVSVEVSPQPVSVTFDGFTKNGLPVDPTSLSGVVSAQVTLDLPEGFEGTLSILFDDIEVASVDLPLAGSPPADGARTPSQIPGHAEIDVATNSVTLVQDEIVARLPDGRDFTAIANLTPLGATDPVASAGYPNGVRMNNYGAIVFDRVTSSGPKYTPPVGDVVYSGSVELRANYVWYGTGPAPQVERIDDVRIVQGALDAAFGGEAVGNRVNFVLSDALPFPDGIANEDGQWSWGETARVTYMGGTVVDRPILNFDPRIVGGQFPIVFAFDNRPPDAFDVQIPSRWFSESTDLAEYAKEHGFGASAGFPVDRFSGIDHCEFAAGLDFHTPEFQGFQFGGELRETGSLELQWGASCFDPLGNGRPYQFTDGGGPSLLGGTFQIPFAERGAGGIGNRESNPAGEFKVTAVDPLNGLGGSAGIDLDIWRLSQSIRTATTFGCLVGTDNGAEGCDPINPTFPFASFALAAPSESSEVRTTVQVRNKAGTWSNLLGWRNVYDTSPPTLSGTLVTDGLLFDKVGQGEAVSGLSGNDDLKVRRFSLEGTLGAPLNLKFGLFRDRLGRDDFTLPYTFDATTEPAPRSVQYVEFDGLQWVPQNPILRFKEAIARISDSARNAFALALNLDPILSPPTTTTFFSQGVEDFRLYTLGLLLICNSAKDFDCGGVPEEVLVTVEAFALASFDFNTFNRIVLYASSVVQGKDPVFWPVASTQTLELTDFGAHRRARANFIVNATAFSFPGGPIILRALAISQQNDALMANDLMGEVHARY